MAEIKNIARRQQILEAGRETIARYGYRRTSMDDIAKAVGVSRPALYQHFKNKSEIYRGVVSWVCDQSLFQVEDALSRDAPLSERLGNALKLGITDPHREVENMPHGDEILSFKDELATDILEDWGAKIGEKISRAFENEPAVDSELAISLSHTLMNVISGLKARGLNADAMEQELGRTLAVLSLAWTR